MPTATHWSEQPQARHDVPPPPPPPQSNFPFCTHNSTNLNIIPKHYNVKPSFPIGPPMSPHCWVHVGNVARVPARPGSGRAAEYHQCAPVCTSVHLCAGPSAPLEPRKPFRVFLFAGAGQQSWPRLIKGGGFLLVSLPVAHPPTPCSLSHPPAGIPASCASACHTTGFGMERLRALCRRARGPTLTNPLCPAWEW